MGPARIPQEHVPNADGFVAGERFLASVSRRLRALEGERLIERLWARDHTLWRESPQEIADRLGWLDAVEWARARLGEIGSFAAELRASGVQDVVLLGMGGSSLAPEVFRRTFGSAPGHPRLHVLDTTSPAAIRQLTEALDAERLHVLVASKSGSTIEVRTLLAYFRAFVESATGAAGSGDHFSAITDPGTGLEQLARERGFRRVFRNAADVGGRYSALSFFGLVPASVLGVDVAELLSRAAAMAESCRSRREPATNPGCSLGATLGEAVRLGCDKLTLLISPRLASFGLWVEQLLAESTGKDGTGVIPIVGEPWVERVCTAEDRLFVTLRLDGDENEALDRAAASITTAGRPLFRITVPEVLALGAEMFRWEFATAVCGHVLGVHPFDQPDVQSTKERTQQILAGLSSGHGSPEVPAGDAAELLAGARPGDYAAILIFGAASPELEEACAELRRALVEVQGIATTLGYGPRFLHSTGQLHKGGSDRGVFVQILLDEDPLPIPGESFGFRELLGAQATGDLEALRSVGRRVVRARMGEDAAAGVAALARSVRAGGSAARTKA
jgi:glucose-6-phosphate isomerase